MPVSFCGVILHEKHGLVLVKPQKKFLLEKLVVHLVISTLSFVWSEPPLLFFYKRPLVHILSHVHPFQAVPPLQNYPFVCASSLQLIRRKFCRQSIFCC